MARPPRLPASRIRREKDALLEALEDLREDLLAKAYGSLCRGESAKELAKSLRKTQLDHMARLISLPFPQGKAWAESKAQKAKEALKAGAPILLAVAACSNRARKRVSGDAPKGRAGSALKALKEEDAFKQSAKAKRESANKYEAEIKTLEEGQAVDNAREAREYLWICSSHGDCAEDHEAYQGRLYYDNGWKRYLKGKERERMERIISKYGVTSFQKVQNRPAWLFTRPNCRHYFDSVSLDEAEKKTPKEILTERGMIHAIGPRRGNQTIRHSTKEGWYTKENVEAIIRQYEERVATLERMWEEQPSAELRRDIMKARMLVKKWKDYLKSHF